MRTKEQMNEKVEILSAAFLRPFREFDREARPFRSDMDAFEADILANGIIEPVLLGYNPDTRIAALIEGNHRLAIALRHNLPVPTLVVRYYVQRGMAVRGMEPDEFGYVPGEIRPSDIL